VGSKCLHATSAGGKAKKNPWGPSDVVVALAFTFAVADSVLPADASDAAPAPAEAALLFGRGLRAGVDRREQKKASANHEADLLRKAWPRLLLR
jgi:hypothetical protein